MALTVATFWHRFSREVSRDGKCHILPGMRVSEVGELRQAVQVGPRFANRRKISSTIPLAEGKEEPVIQGDYLVDAELATVGGKQVFRKRRRSGIFTYNVKGGLITGHRGGVQEDIAKLRKEGVRIPWLGSFVVDKEAVMRLLQGMDAETLDGVGEVVVKESREYGLIHGLGTPRFVDSVYEFSKAGFVMNCEFGLLSLHQFTPQGVNFWDMTDDAEAQSMVEAHMKTTQALVEEKRAAEKATRKPPPGHPDES